MAVLTTNRSYALSIDWAKQMRNFSKDRRSLQQIIADHSLFFALMHSQISFKWLAPYSEKAKVFVLRTMEMRQGIDNILTVYHPNASEGAWRQV